MSHWYLLLSFHIRTSVNTDVTSRMTMTIHVLTDNIFRSDVTTHPPPVDLKAMDVQHSNDDALHSAVLHLYRAIHLLHHPVNQALVRTRPAGKRKLGSWEQTASYSESRKVMLLIRLSGLY